MYRCAWILAGLAVLVGSVRLARSLEATDPDRGELLRPAPAEGADPAGDSSGLGLARPRPQHDRPPSDASEAQMDPSGTDRPPLVLTNGPEPAKLGDVAIQCVMRAQMFWFLVFQQSMDEALALVSPTYKDRLSRSGSLAARLRGAGPGRFTPESFLDLGGGLVCLVGRMQFADGRDIQVRMAFENGRIASVSGGPALPLE
jgi:hypothetical protein